MSNAVLLCLSLAFIGMLLSSPKVQETDAAKLSPLLQEEPKQDAPELPNFNFPYHGRSYLIYPRANYQIRGLVVTQNKVGSITDAYHTSDSVDLKDVCVVWGDNVATGIYRRANYWSEPWTCNYEFKDRSAYEEFNPRQLSNNHLLGGSDKVRKIIRSINIGDVIEINGMLVDYADSATPDSLRKTSLVRSDKGNGACEVLFVAEISILRPHAMLWHKLYASISWGALLAFLIRIALFLTIPVLEHHRPLPGTKHKAH